MTLLNKLLTADVVCCDCGAKYGKYSVGCSSTWNGTCGVCGENKPVTEVRDWGYLTRGINELKGAEVRPFAELTKDFSPERKANIKEQSKVVASYMASVGPIMSDSELEDCLKASYEMGEIACMFTEDEIGFLNECLDTIQEHHPGLKENDLVEVTLFEGIVEKITTLYDDYCVKYQLSPAMKAYVEKYGTFPDESDNEKWEGFRDAFVMLQGAVNG